MSCKTGQKRVVKELVRLLRLLCREDTVLVREDVEGQGARSYGVYTKHDETKQRVLRPDQALVEHCIAEDLLTKTPAGWTLGANGALALRRMLAGADPFSEQHQERTIQRRTVNDERQSVVVNDRSTPLGWLARRKGASGEPIISKTQFAAGERLALDFQYAGMMPRITASWSGPGIGGQRRSAPGTGVEMSDNRLAARQRVRAAVKEVGSDLADIMLDICCFQLGLAEVEKTRGWPRRSGKLILQIALDRLALHYGMKQKNATPATTSRISHWGAEGYKP